MEISSGGYNGISYTCLLSTDNTVGYEGSDMPPRLSLHSMEVGSHNLLLTEWTPLTTYYVATGAGKSSLVNALLDGEFAVVLF